MGNQEGFEYKWDCFVFEQVLTIFVSLVAFKVSIKAKEQFWVMYEIMLHNTLINLHVHVVLN